MRELTWEKIGRLITFDGTVNIYQAKEADIRIESRKRQIPHANGIGTWTHTSFFVIKDDQEVAEKYSLADAKEFAEGLEG